MRGSIAALAVASLLTLSACSEDSSEPEAAESSAAAPESEDPAESAAPEAPEPDLENIPDPVAQVNGDEISRDDFVRAYEIQFQSLASQAQSSGAPLDQDQLKMQTAENLVGNALLDQEADRRKITASDAAIDKEVSSLLEQNGLKSQAELEPLLEQQGLTLEDLLEQVETQVRVNQLIAAVSPGARKVSDKEVKALYDQVSEQQGAAGQGQELPPLEDVRTEIVSQIRTDKAGEAAQKLVDGLRKKADVTIEL